MMNSLIMKSFRRLSRWSLPLSFVIPAAVILSASSLAAQDADPANGPSAVEGAATLRSSPQTAKIQAALAEARAELATLRVRYKDGHPTIVQQLNKIAALEQQLGSSGGATTVVSTAIAVPSRYVTLDFPGGSLSQLLEAVGKTDASSFNLVVDEHAVRENDVKVRAFSLRNAPPVAVAATLSFLLADQKLAVEKLIPDLVRGGEFQPGPDVYVVRPPQSGGNSVRFEAFQLENRLGAQSIDDIVGAIRAAWELDPAHQPDALRLKFHPGTSLLFVSGSQEALNVASLVVTSLKRVPGDPRSAPSPTPPAK